MNLDAIDKQIRVDSEFGSFAKNVSIGKNFPNNAVSFTKIFDLYCKHYIELFDGITRQIYDMANSIPKDKRRKINQHSKNINDENDKMFYELNMIMIDTIMYLQHANKNGSHDAEISKIMALSDEAKQIEIKLGKIMSVLKLSDPKQLLQLPESKKLFYFFSAFLSAAGRKPTGAKSNPTVGAHVDELGNMLICPEAIVENTRLGKMICDYYVFKDNCAYIQIADTIYALRDDFNIFQIPNLPLFEKCLTKFDVRLKVSDDLEHVRLDVRAIEPDEQMKSSMTSYSFKKKDSNFLGKKLEKIIIKGS